MPRFNRQTLLDLIEEESKVANQLQEQAVKLNDQYETDKSFTEEMVSKYFVDQQYHAQLSRQLETIRGQRNRYELLEPDQAKSAFDSAFARWLRDGDKALEEHERELYLGEVIDGNIPDGGGQTFKIGAATRSDDGTGQESVQEEIPPRIIDRLAFYGGVSRAAQQFFTGTGGDYRLMQMDAASQEGEILDAQNTAVSALDLPNIGVITFTSKTASSKPIILTREVLQDAVFDIETYAQRQAVRRMGRVWNRVFTTTEAALTNGPEGVVTMAKDGITAASRTAVTWVELTNLIYEIDRAYRESEEMGEGGFMAEMGGMLGYMLSDGAEKLVRILTDSDGRPLWVPSTREGVPSMLNGFPYQVNGNMASPAAGTIPFLFGNFSYYGIRTAREIEMFRFQDSRTMQRNTVEMLALSRRDARYMGAVTGASPNRRCEAVARLTMLA